MSNRKDNRSLILDKTGKPFVHGKPNSAMEEIFNYDTSISQEDIAYLELLRTRRVRVPMGKIDQLISFWKDKYFRFTIEGRHMNGLEVEQLANPKTFEDPREANYVPYVAMCNLMLLEALRLLGEDNPSTTNCHKLAFGSEKEMAIADLWKKNFQPLAFQAEWAWAGALAILVGEPQSWSDIIDNYHEQL
jgi:hypothetical protein